MQAEAGLLWKRSMMRIGAAVVADEVAKAGAEAAAEAKGKGKGKGKGRAAAAESNPHTPQFSDLIQSHSGSCTRLRRPWTSS